MKETHHHILLLLVAAFLALGALQLTKAQARKSCSENVADLVAQTVDLDAVNFEEAEALRDYYNLFYELCMHSKGYQN